MLRRWAVVTRDDIGKYDIESWHLTARGASNRREYLRFTDDGRGAVLLVMPRKRALEMVGTLR